MKLLPHFFQKASIEKMFFLFPDPHFKKRKNKWRIVSHELLAEYAYLLKVNQGIVYTITDVEEVYHWTVEKFNGHPLFEQIPNEEMKDDPAFIAIFKDTFGIIVLPKGYNPADFTFPVLFSGHFWTVFGLLFPKVPLAPPKKAKKLNVTVAKNGPPVGEELKTQPSMNSKDK